MRTYSRKRMKHQLIDDVQNLCRLCLQKPDASVPIYNGQDTICASLALRIMICVGLEVTRDECLPNVVCTECYKELERCYSFRKKCEVTYQKLKSHALAVKEKRQDTPLLVKDQDNCKGINITKHEEVPNHNLEQDVNMLVLPHKENKEEINMGNVNGVDKADVNLGNVIEIADNHNEENHQSMEDPNFEAFLSTVLLQLGIMATVDDKLTLLDRSVRTLEIETGNGKFLVELTEEREEVKRHVALPEVLNENNESLTNQPNRENKTAKEGLPRCEACGKQFATRSVLARHRRVHSGERPHACRVCSRRFAQRGVMLRHELVHKEQRPHQCSQCPKSFTQRGALEAHLRSHAPPHQRALNLHRCPRCPKLFLYASGLSRHMRAHSGHMFACSACARPFRDKSSLLRHVRSARHPAA